MFGWLDIEFAIRKLGILLFEVDRKRKLLIMPVIRVLWIKLEIQQRFQDHEFFDCLRIELVLIARVRLLMKDEII